MGDPRMYEVLLCPEADSGFSVFVPELPSVATQGETCEEALDMAKEAIEGYLEAMTEDDAPIVVEVRPVDLLGLEGLISELSGLYSADQARVWLSSPHRRLDGERPVDLIRQGKVDEVRALIAHMRDGSFV